MSEIFPAVDRDGLLEYSVVFSDRSLSHMSDAFRQVMNDISAGLKAVYAADAVVLIPGGGSFAMEAVARQFAHDQRCVVIRNGWFSYRWSQILETGRISDQVTVLKARPEHDGFEAPWAPVPIDQAVSTIRSERPQLVFAPHVETSAGMQLPDSYIRELANAAHAVDGLLVLDCVASGTAWIDMRALGVDVLISAPQKGWSASPCAGLVMLSQRALTRMESRQSSSFAADMNKWLQIMRSYEQGAHGYHATLPTDALAVFRNTMQEIREAGLEWARERQLTLGTQVRALLAEHGFPSVAAAGFAASGIVVCHTVDAQIQNGSRFAAHGLQIAAGVPLMCDERDTYRSFRIGLFGLDKLRDVDGCVQRLRAALEAMQA